MRDFEAIIPASGWLMGVLQGNIGMEQFELNDAGAVTGRRQMRLALAASVFVIAAGITVAVVRHLTGNDNVYGLVPLFDLDGDGNLPAVLSATLLLTCSALCFINARAVKGQPAARYRHWRFLMYAFLVMTVDELAGLHELLDRPVGALVDAGGILAFAWVIPASIFALGLLIAYLPFLLELPRDIALRLLLAGAIYVGGAVGIDAISGMFWEADGRESAAYMTTSILEETAEIAGLLLFIDACLRYLVRRGVEWNLRLSFGRGTGSR